MLARDELRQVLRLLLGGAVQPDLVDAEVRVRAVAQRHAGGGAGDLLDRHHVREIAEPGAAVFLGHGDAEQAELAHLAPELGREDVRAVDLGRHRRHAAPAPRTAPSSRSASMSSPSAKSSVAVNIGDPPNGGDASRSHVALKDLAERERLTDCPRARPPNRAGHRQPPRAPLQLRNGRRAPLRASEPRRTHAQRPTAAGWARLGRDSL